MMKDLIPNKLSVSAQYVIENSTFCRHDDPKNPGYFWFVKIGVPNLADYIFRGSPHTTNSKGMGGATMPFKCADGTIYIQGPWWSNADAFKESTGIDYTELYFTRVIISTSQDDPDSILYRDKNPVIGSFSRWKQILIDLFKQYPDIDSMYVYSGSLSGSSLVCEQRKNYTDQV